jgi:hypothetical protein
MELLTKCSTLKIYSLMSLPSGNPSKNDRKLSINSDKWIKGEAILDERH